MSNRRQTQREKIIKKAKEILLKTKKDRFEKFELWINP